MMKRLFTGTKNGFSSFWAGKKNHSLLKNTGDELKKAYVERNEKDLEPVVNLYDTWADAPDDVLRGMVDGYCTPEESERVVHPQNSKDYLLRLRAVYIADHTRTWRVFLHLRRIFGKEWSLEKYFSSDAYDAFRSMLGKEEYKKCKDVACGNIYDNNANGLIFASPHGILSTYSVSLRYFSIYANLALGGFEQEVPWHVRLNSMRIACRVMLNTEAQDFIFDPRGIIPEKIMNDLKTEWWLNNIFLAGHEFSHFILGHIKEENKEEMGFLKPHFKDDTDYRKIYGYTVSQKQEFEADLAALNLVDLTDEEYSVYYCAALNWFAILAVYEGVEDSISPPNGFNQTHPGAIARYTNLIERARRPKDFDEKIYVETLPELVSFWRDIMINDAAEHIEMYEMYGSAYLDKPNTAWRGKELIDRVDY